MLHIRRVQHAGDALHPLRHGARRRGFTLIEATFVIGVIFLLVAIAAVAASRALTSAQRSGEQIYIRSIDLAVQQFKQDQGFLPPLVDDSDPVVTDRTIGIGPRLASGATSNPDFDLNRYRNFLEGRNLQNQRRWSYNSLPYYLTGVLDDEVDGQPLDGASGPQMARVQEVGRFDRRGKVSGAPLQIDKETRRFKRFPTVDPYSMALVDRWGFKQVPTTPPQDPPIPNVIRYYRWRPWFNNGPVVQEYNLPEALGQTRTATGGREDVDVEFRESTYAVVSVGPDGVAGDEDIALLRTRLGVDASMSDDEVRARARSDNIVEFGR